MAAVKRRRGRPRKSLAKTDHFDYDVSYEPAVEQKEFMGDVIYAAASIINVHTGQSNPAEWVTMVTPSQTCLHDGCQKLHLHCPLCPVSITWFDDEASLQSHFTKIHTNQCFHYSDHVIALCNLGCMDSFASHYHCPKCGVTIGRSHHMRNHLNRCTAKHNVNEMDEPLAKRITSRKRPRLLINDGDVDSLWETVYLEIDRNDGSPMERLQTNTDNNTSKVFIDEDLNVSLGNIQENRALEEDLQCERDMTKVLDQNDVITDTNGRQGAEDVSSDSGLKMTDSLKRLNDPKIEAGYPILNNSGTSSVDPEPPPSDFVRADGKIEDNPMEDEPLPAPEYPHISIVRKLEDLECRRCQTCCRLFHCPLCPRDLYRSQVPRIIYNHLSQHYLRGVQYKGWTSMKCNLACGCENDGELVKAHWHCPLCPQRKLHRSRLRQHLDFHENGRTRSCRGRQDYHIMSVGSVPVGDVSNLQAMGGNRVTDAITGDNNHSTIDGIEERVSPSLSTDVCGLGLPSDTVYTIKMEPDNQNKITDHEQCCVNDVLTGDTVDLCNYTAASAEVQESVPCSASSDQNTSEIHVIYINDVLAQNDASHIAQVENSVILQKTFGNLEQQAPNCKNEITENDGNTIVSNIRGNDNIVIENDGIVRIGENMVIQGDVDNLGGAGQNGLVQDDNNMMIRDDMFSESCNKQVKPDVSEGSDNENAATISEEDKRKSSEVFQVITGVLTSDLVQKLEPVLNQFMDRLQNTTGILVIIQDSHDYLLQGSWTQIHKSQIILNKVSQWDQITALDVDSVFDQAQLDYPDLFAVQSEPDTTAPVIQDYESIPSKDEVEHLKPDSGAFRILSNEPCPYCLKRFRYKVSLFCHIIYTHDIRKKPKINSDKWKTMLQRMAKVDKPQCPSCGRKFTKIIHAQTHYGTNVCTSTRTNLYASLRDPVTGTYRCDQCSYSAPTPSVLTQHVAYKHTKKTVSCPKCDKMFASDHILRTHLNYVHAPDDSCPVCGVRVKRRHLAKHARIHHGKNNRELLSLKCGHCDYYTNTPQLLERHVRREHQLEAKRCTECGKRFQVMYDLYRHRQLEHGITVSKFLSQYGHCPVCKKQMLKRNILVHVRLKHYNDRRYRCPTCSKLFQTKYVLNMHKETHLPTAERCYRYLCAQCNMGFMTNATYLDHIVSHNNTQPYKCSVCGSSFRQKNAYRRHMQNHSQNERRRADACEKANKPEQELDHDKSKQQGGDAAKLESNFMFVCLCEQAFSDMASLQQHTESCLAMGQTPGQVENSSASDLMMQTSGDTLILIQPNSTFMSEGRALSGSHQEELFILKTDDSDETTCDGLTDDVVNGVDEIQNMNMNQLAVVHDDRIGLSEPDQINTSLINDGVDNCLSQDGDRFLCGYCSQLFVGLDDVQKHILIEHGDKLSS